MTAYITQLHEKVQRLRAMLQPFHAPDLCIFDSPERHYRMRAEFRIWHEGADISYAMFEHGEKASSASVIRLQDFPAAHENINRLMPELLAKIAQKGCLKNRLYQCEFLTGLSGETLVSLIYHRRLDEEWEAAARVLQDELGVFIIGRSKGQKIVLSQDFITEELTVHGEVFRYRQTEGGFTQPNAVVCQKMLQWACEQAQSENPRDLLELYCGNGNFTLPLARHFRRVLATELSKTSVQAALWNKAENGVDNMALARLSAQEFAQAFSGSREFYRLKEAQIDLKDYDFSTILIDPPRAGVDDESLKLVAQFERVIYISCNPETLCANLQVLCQTHEIQAAALFDQFPFTQHIESGVVLRRKAA
ncbi:MAG: tRNA (uridine(54)-C5)-methyltransferase TrmA [Alysiella sp.]|uniref:tRNA (uridine(54)-C5)-methyltransferase TrmA n=1 Tax=Alysiella sp. TaxID=1872483 RepID=UPI0026DD0916|nr:tRNA (uridine(54)-C5)-methyltransferase TrmA [Alysiella sp.]MDO4434040.1 tRNA (uridine(54)-C5)-methyltransferase TrmA [Alysiella sp.]